jgi:hypothetical protein
VLVFVGVVCVFSAIAFGFWRINKDTRERPIETQQVPPEIIKLDPDAHGPEAVTKEAMIEVSDEIEISYNNASQVLQC